MGFAAPFQAAGGGNPYAIMMAAAIGAVLAPIGAVVGAGSAMSLKEAMVSESTLRKALADMKIQESPWLLLACQILPRRKIAGLPKPDGCV